MGLSEGGRCLPGSKIALGFSRFGQTVSSFYVMKCRSSALFSDVARLATTKTELETEATFLLGSIHLGQSRSINTTVVTLVDIG